MAETVKHTPAEQPDDSGVAASRGTSAAENWNLDLLLDIELPFSVLFGNAEMPLKDVLNLGAGSVIELDRAVNDPVTILVDHKPIARGEVVTVDGNYGVRILEVGSSADHMHLCDEGGWSGSGKARALCQPGQEPIIERQNQIGMPETK